jgi:hypothetical protein
MLRLYAFCLFFFFGCGSVTESPATSLVPGPDRGTLDGAASDLGSAALADGGSGGAEGGQLAETPRTDVGGSEAAPSPDAGDVAPIRPTHCAGSSADYRTTVCKPGCGTCQQLHEATSVAGCWTSDDFHCVDSCAGCR